MFHSTLFLLITTRFFHQDDVNAWFNMRTMLATASHR